jgi:indole-3-glycerol phosphate synthase
VISGSLIDDLIGGVRAGVEKRESEVSQGELKARALRVPEALDVVGRLHSQDAVSVIAEVKRSSPSHGPLADIPDPAELARGYQAGGAAMISVITEEQFFHGSVADLDAVRNEVAVPVLYKDFVVTPYQVWEARAHGADAVSIVVTTVEQPVLHGLVERVHSLGMTALVEAHSADEVARAVDAGARMIGVNARDLRTQRMDTGMFATLAPQIPDHIVRVAASGVRGPADMIGYARSGAHAVLVGESLVRHRTTVADLVAAGRHPSLWAVRPPVRH